MLNLRPLNVRLKGTAFAYHSFVYYILPTGNESLVKSSR